MRIDYYVSLEVVLTVPGENEGEAMESAHQLVEETLRNAGARVRSVKSVSAYQP